MSTAWLLVTLLALELLVSAERHRVAEVREGFGVALLKQFGLFESLSARINRGLEDPVWREDGLRAFRAQPRIDKAFRWVVPSLAFSVVFAGIGIGFSGNLWGFSLAAGFAIADKLITHLWLDLPGDTGWGGPLVAGGLLVLTFEPWAALAGAGALVSFLGGLWGLGKARGWGRG